MSTRTELLKAVEDAARLDQEVRAYTFVGIPHVVAGVEVQAMTGVHFNILFQAKNPYIIGGKTSPADAALLLWVVSPGFSPNLKARRKFIERLNQDTLCSDVSSYIADMFMDAPSGGGTSAEPVADTLAWTVHRIAAAYGWDDSVILAKPLPRLYQYLRLICLDKNPKATFHSKRVRAAWSAYHVWRSNKKKGDAK
jgi:hypothetical protein